MTEFEALAELVTFRPFERPPAHTSPRISPFRSSWSQTVKLLERELRLLGAKRAVMEIDFEARKLRLDGMPRAGAGAITPAICLSFDATGVAGKPNLRYEVGTFTRWVDNVRAVALGLEALRAVDRYGVTKRGEQYRGWAQLEAGGPGEGDVARGRELIAAAGGNVRRALALAHPDHGGSADDFRDVVAARDRGDK